MFKNNQKPKIYKFKENLTGEEANALEIKLIKQFGRKDLGQGTLLNMCDGGEGLINMSPVHKEIIRQRHLGKVNSQETRRKISQSKQGIPNSAEHNKHVSEATKPNNSRKIKKS